MSVALKHVTISINPADGSLVVIPADPLIICPLDSSHRIQDSELQCHLERCLIGDLMEMTCPWNSLHVLDETSYKHHLSICENKPLPALSPPSPPSPAPHREQSPTE